MADVLVTFSDYGHIIVGKLHAGLGAVLSCIATHMRGLRKRRAHIRRSREVPVWMSLALFQLRISQ